MHDQLPQKIEKKESKHTMEGERHRTQRQQRIKEKGKIMDSSSISVHTSIIKMKLDTFVVMTQ